jgi:hypothetical protein
MKKNYQKQKDMYNFYCSLYFGNLNLSLKDSIFIFRQDIKRNLPLLKK